MFIIKKNEKINTWKKLDYNLAYLITFFNFIFNFFDYYFAITFQQLFLTS